MCAQLSDNDWNNAKRQRGLENGSGRQTKKVSKKHNIVHREQPRKRNGTEGNASCTKREVEQKKPEGAGLLDAAGRRSWRSIPRQHDAAAT
jgi:hypothetical protein